LTVSFFCQAAGALQLWQEHDIANDRRLPPADRRPHSVFAVASLKVEPAALQHQVIVPTWQLTNVAEISADNSRNFRIASKARSVNMENDWLQPARDLDATHRNSVVDNVRRVRSRLVNEIVWSRFECEFGVDETASHAIPSI
jgi:hypothetical protein